jgi:diguanylate cyclase (GGDEF)-like protein
VAMLDIDHFKLFNDTYGHREGDACLQQVARACSASVVRTSDLFARYGGEEFAVILPETDDRASRVAAERLRSSVEALAIPHASGEEGIVTASVGIASMVPKRGASPFELIERADRGLYRAKGTGRNRVVCVDSTAPMPEGFPRASVPNNLPADVSNLIGRDADLARIVDLIGRHRAVTLVGSGGVGKTRVALSSARQLAARFPDGVWWLELAALRDGAHLVTALAALFGVEEAPPRPLLESVIAALRTKTLLLVADNCEHLVIEMAQVVTAILQVAPTVCVLATSRERLGISGEATYRVPPLMTPPASAHPAAADALAYPAIRLFVERARGANDVFELTDRNTPAVAEICRRLDGIALAIELAAARVRVLDVDRIASALDRRFRLLGTGDRGAFAHHQTLRATLDWSYDLLGPDERDLFARLAVFAGGFTLDAVIGVCSDDELDATQTFTVLSALVDKSLVAFEEHERYRILETMREYAGERLSESGRRETFARRHAAFFREFVERVSLSEGSGPYRAWLAPLENELDNLRAALNWTLREGNDVACGAAIAAAFVETSSLGRWTEWGDWNRAALAALDSNAEPAVRGRLLTRRAELASHYGAFGGTAAALEASR